MISLLLALAAAQAAPQSDEAQFTSCIALVQSDPKQAVDAAIYGMKCYTKW